MRGLVSSGWATTLMLGMSSALASADAGLAERLEDVQSDDSSDRDHFSTLLDSIDGLPEREQVRELNNHLESHKDCPDSEAIKGYIADLKARREDAQRRGPKRKVTAVTGDGFDSPVTFASAQVEARLSAGATLGLPGWGEAALRGSYALTPSMAVLGSLGGAEGYRVVTLEGRLAPEGLQREGQRLAFDVGLRGELGLDSLLRVETRVQYALRPKLTFLPGLEVQAMGGLRVRVGAPFSARVLLGLSGWMPVHERISVGLESLVLLRPILANRPDLPEPVWMVGTFCPISLAGRYRISEKLSAAAVLSVPYQATLTQNFSLAGGIEVEYLF